MKALPAETDYVVVGAGIAGLRAAIGLASVGRVLVLAKTELTESATQYAQGGIAAALSDDDEVSLHLQDTLNAGDGLCNEEAARILTEEGPERIQELIDWGTEFDRSGAHLTFTREGAHSRNRILHAHGDSTGREIARALYFKAKALKHVSFSEFEFTRDLLVEDGRVRGVTLIDAKGDLQTLRAAAVLLATGGLGQVYRETTNPSVATGDGVAMAHRAGAVVSDMEFVQFHPTALYLKDAPRFLLSEALRGEGAFLRNSEMLRFMPKYHDLAELAPRDVVARAIAHELEVSRAPEPVVYLDMTHLNGAQLRARFPRIHSTCLEYNVDIATDLVPVRPAAHYAMGGVKTDLDGRTSLKGLYAAGEVACTGVHGANRLASNSLLEGLVYGARAAQVMQQEAPPAPVHAGRAHAADPPKHAANPGKHAEDKAACQATEALIDEVRALMWNKVGVVRSGHTLREAIRRLEEWKEKLPMGDTRRQGEARNIHLTGWLIARSALAREESRGAHYRTDFPAHDDARFKKHSVVRGEKVSFE
ncbi:MAG TPA: L-aspartate oxidase [Terriglobales bacterium]|jgi:L-aspartate oxidase|nr:L-aspartate oxidase [Terriglobales bacterium]